MTSLTTVECKSDASGIGLDLVRQLVREELATFAKEHLAQITNSVEQTSKLLREQMLRSGEAAVPRSSSKMSTPAFLPFQKAETASGADDEVGTGLGQCPVPPTPVARPVQAIEPAQNFSASTPIGLQVASGFPAEGDLMNSHMSCTSDVDSPKSTWSSRARRVSMPKVVPTRRMSRRVSNSEQYAGDSQSRRASKSERKPKKRISLTEALLEPLLKHQTKANKKYSERQMSILAETPSDLDESNCCVDIVEAPLFVYIICIAIFANAILIGVQTNYMATNLTTHVPAIYFVLEGAFCVVFTLEIVLRFCAYGCQFFTMPDWKWNVFDVLVVLLQVVDNGISLALYSKHSSELSEISENTDSIGALYLLRFFRLLRILRLVRTVHIVGEFQAIIVAIASSLRPLCWTVVLLMLLIYMLGVCFTQMVTDHLVAVQWERKQAEKQEELQAFFGSLGTSMMSLFQSISDGIEWREVVAPLTPTLNVLFVMYIAFSAFAFMNMLTGIFVDKALQSGQAERRKFLLKQVWSIFSGGDRVEETGKVTWADFQAHLQDPSMQSILQAIDVDQDDAHELFHLLDVHHDGAIEIGEFVHGCLHLEGPAKAIDLAAFVQESRQMNQKWINQAQFVSKTLVQIHKQILNLEQLNTFARGVSGGSKVSSTDLERVESP